MSATHKTNWFWSDWSGDQAVRRLTPDERGVWIDLLALAAVGKPVGYVSDAKGRPVALEEIGRFTNCADLGRLAKLIAGIVEKGAASRDRAGRLFNRRMVRDGMLRTQRSEAGKLGAKALNEKRSPTSVKQNAKQNGKRSGASLTQESPQNSDLEERTLRTRASPDLIQPAAFDLADRVGDALGWDPDDTRRCGVPYEAQKWLSNAWSADLCVDTIRRVVATKPNKPLAYFVPAIAQAHADMAAPLPSAPANIVNLRTANAQAAPHHPGGAYGASKDRFREVLAALDASIAEDERCEKGGEPPAEILPPARRERS